MNRFLIFVFSFVSLCFLSSIEFCFAQQTIRGYLNQVDLEQGTIALQLGKNLPSKSYSLANKSVAVTTSSGHKAKLSELKKGLYVVLTLSQADDVAQIWARSPRSYGYVKTADTEKRMLTVKGLTKKQPDRIIPIAEKAGIYLHSQKVGLDALYTGLYVLMDHSLDGKTIVTARADLRRTAKDPRGVIIGIDGETRKLTLLVGGETQPRTLTYPVDEEFKCVFDNKPVQIKLSNLPVAESFSNLVTAATVWCMLNDDNKSIAAISATSRRLKGTIGEIDPAKRSFSILLDGGVKLSFIAPKKTLIYVDGRAAAFKNLAPGMLADVQVAFDPSSVIRVFAKPKQ